MIFIPIAIIILLCYVWRDELIFNLKAKGERPKIIIPFAINLFYCFFLYVVLHTKNTDAVTVHPTDEQGRIDLSAIAHGFEEMMADLWRIGLGTIILAFVLFAAASLNYEQKAIKTGFRNALV